MSDTVLYHRAEGVATITLNRPEALNALDTPTKEGLAGALGRARDDGDVRAVLLTGAGRTFCAGQDLHEQAETVGGTGSDVGDVDLGDTVREHYNPTIRRITEMPKPVVAGMNGTAAGAGVSLALACDFRVLADTAKLSMAFASIGLTADSGASWSLPRLIGRSRALEMLILGEPVTAQRAVELGLATSVVEAGELPAAAHDLAARLAAGPTVAYHAIRSAVDYGLEHGLAQTLEREAELQAACGETADHRGAKEAFRNKETPRFEGR